MITVIGFLIAVQALVSWAFAVVAARHRDMDGVFVLLLAPLWGLGIPAVLWWSWRQRVVLQGSLQRARHRTAVVLRTLAAGIVGWPRSVLEATRTLREVSGYDQDAWFERDLLRSALTPSPPADS